MRISPITYTPINFRANERFIRDSSDNLVYKTTTYWFRGDTDWDRLNNYLCSKYNDTDKVNVICHACSNGMEPYSFAMHMKIFHPNYADKFLPVIAKDLDKENIDMANNGFYETTDIDLYQLDYYTNGDFRNYFDLKPSRSQNIFTNIIALSANEELRKYVNFEQGDIFRDIENMPKKNTVLFCKNFWPYLTEQKREELAQKLSKQFDDTCVIITGDYDSNKSNIKDLLKKNGFREFPMENVWLKYK